MTYIIFIGLAILSLFNKKNKYITLAWIIFLVILATFNISIADRSNYISMYENTNSYDSVYFQRIEPGLRVLILGGHFLHLSYMQFYCLYFTIIIMLYVITIRRYTEDVNLVLLLFALFPFPIEVVQLRGMLADVIVLYSIRFLEKRNLKNIVAFILCIILAGLIHNEAFFFIIFGLKFFAWDKRRFIFANSILALVVLFLLANGSFMTFISRFAYSARANIYLESSSSGTRGIFDCILIIVLLVISTYLYGTTHGVKGQYYGLKAIINDTKSGKNTSKYNGEIWEIQFYISILSIWVVPLIVINRQFYRLIRPFFMIFYISFASFLNSKKEIKHYKFSNGIYLFVLILFILLFIYVDCGGVFSKTYLPLMNDNQILYLF